LRNVLQSEKQRELEDKKAERKDVEFVPDPIKDQRQEELNLQRQARLKAKAERDSIMELKKAQRLRDLQKQKKKRDSINIKNFN
jgi:hypothetical protein